MSKLILSVNPNYTVDFVKGLVEKAIAEMRLTEYIESIESREDTGSFVKIGRPIDISELANPSSALKAELGIAYEGEDAMRLMRKMVKESMVKDSKYYTEFLDENDDNAEKGQANDET